jgi:uncharacterized protein (TIGR02246 family)
MVQAEMIRTAVDGYFAANNALDADAVARLFSVDARMHRVPGTAPIEGRETIRQIYGHLLSAFARSEVEAVQTFIAGNGAAVLYRGKFTARSGGAIALEGINVFGINEQGEIQAITYYWDPAPLTALLQR